MAEFIITPDAPANARRIAQTLARLMAERTPTGELPPITFTTGDTGAGYALESNENAATIRAATPSGLAAGVGALFTAIRFVDGDWRLPDLKTTAEPSMPVRPIYFATHFGNFYDHAPEREVTEYIEELALYGYDMLVTWFDLHHYRDFDDGKATWDRLVMFDRAARGVGMKTARIAIANESFESQARPELRAVGRPPGTGYETDLCPSLPEARQIILDDKRRTFELLRDTTEVDLICLWPYDQGGCVCERCAPWPKTYLPLCDEIAATAHETLPGVEVAASAWWIGMHFEGEDDAFFAQLDKERGWLRTIVAGASELKRWRAQGRAIPDRYKVVLFPEISMFDAMPWGARGANPAPARFASEYEDLKDVLAGAMPYSEGRYEDINKFVWGRLQWSIQPVEEVVSQYATAFLGEPSAADLIRDIENGLTDRTEAVERLRQGRALERSMQPWSTSGWRWEIIRARLLIDALRTEYERGSTDVIVELRAAYEHLQHTIYHHDERSLDEWITSPFERWLTKPLNDSLHISGEAIGASE